MYRLEIAETVEKISNVTSQRTLVNRAIQTALERVYNFHDFPYYIQDKGCIKTTNDYSTGTVSITNGSTTVTGSGTSWTSAMVGRKIRFESQTAYYRISAVGSTISITLEQPFQGTTDTSATYVIFQDEYRLAPDVDKYKIIKQIENGIPLYSSPPTDFDESNPMPTAYGDPTLEVMEGTLLDTYSTGTITGVVNTSTLTGSGTSWTSVEGMGRMTKIKSGTSVLTVKSVDSDTQITVYETISTSIAASSTYEAIMNNLRVQVNPLPDAQKLLYYRYFRIPAPLTSDYDIPDMPHSWHWLLIYGALAMVLLQKGDVTKAQEIAEARFVSGMGDMKLKLGSFTPDRIYSRRSTDRMRSLRGRLDGLEEASYDRRFSS